MSLFKYFNEQGTDDHGGTLAWIGNRPDLPPLRPRQPIAGLTPEQVDDLDWHHDFKREKLRLWVKDELDRYVAIRDRAVNGDWYIVHKCTHHWVEAHQDELVIIEWTQTYGDPHGSATGQPALSNASG